LAEYPRTIDTLARTVWYFKLVAFDIVVDEADRRTCLRALQSVRSRERQEKVRLVHRDVPITRKHFLARLLIGESKAPET
jgi:hypothetical protein